MPGWWHRYLAWRQRHVGRIELTDTGFVSIGYRERVAIDWTAIDRITAYKRDLYTVDQLCLAILASGAMLEINESMRGYDRFDDALHTALGVSHEWKLRVLFPAFEPNVTDIFVRDAGDAMVAS